MKRKISFDIEEEIIKEIDRAATKDCRSRTSFLIKSSLDRARKILKNDGKDNE